VDSNGFLTIVLPALNEEEAVGRVIDELRELGYERILLVDGHSVDKTVELAKKRGVMVVPQDGIGKDGAIRTAIDNVETPYFLVMDCDYTYDPRDIDRLLVGREKYDMIIGARSNGRSNISTAHRFGNWAISSTFKYLLGSGLTDVCSGMYLLRTEAVKEINLNNSGFSVEVNIASQMTMRRTVGEVPISYRKRIGEQKLSSWTDGPKILNSVFTIAKRYNPLFLFIYLAFAAGLLATLSLIWTVYDVLARGIWHSGLALFGVMLMIIAFQCFMLAVISVLLKRIERRIEK